MKDRSLAFIGISIFVAAAFIAGYTLGAVVASRASEQIAVLQESTGSEPDLDAIEARSNSALDEIRTLYQGMTVLASWYGAPYHGRRASNGEIYDMTRDTVAHRTLPLGTIVVLENTANGRLAIGRVTDRGPYIDGRALDVSRAIADELGMIKDGLATVRMWAVRIPTGMMVAGRASEGD